MKPNPYLTPAENLWGVSQEPQDTNAVIGIAGNPFLSTTEGNNTDLTSTFVQQNNDPTSNARTNLRRLLSNNEQNF